MKTLFTVLLITISVIISKCEETISIPEGFTSEYEQWTDGWLFDLTTYNHPDWSDEKIEDYLFLTRETFNLKYNEK